MTISLRCAVEHFPIAGQFTISRGSKTIASVVTCTILSGAAQGKGECVPYGRYGETVDGVLAEIEAARALVESGVGRHRLRELMKAGAARNAIDCALWDLEAKTAGAPAHVVAGVGPPTPLTTAYTISLGEPEVMAAQAAQHAHRALLKIKVGTGDDESRILAVRNAAPDSGIVLDANEGWTPDSLAHHFAVCVKANVLLIEQPLPADRDRALAAIARPIPVCADESVHQTVDLASLCDRYDAINIKLDKAGGLTEALMMREAARGLGLKTMIGCMVATSLAMAPAVLLAQGADFVDLDGPLLLARDRVPGLRYDASLVFPPTCDLWG